MRIISKTKVCFIIIIMAFCISFTCCDNNTPPDVDSVQEHFLNNYSDIQVIVEYMVSSPYENVYIMDANGTMQADLTWMEIADEEVMAAVNNLLKNGEYIQIIKIGNTISLLQWCGTRDIECGIAYSINRTDAPDVQFMTTVVPITEDGWYYYIADYNKWRNTR